MKNINWYIKYWYYRIFMQSEWTMIWIQENAINSRLINIKNTQKYSYIYWYYHLLSYLYSQFHYHHFIYLFIISKRKIIQMNEWISIDDKYIQNKNYWNIYIYHFQLFNINTFYYSSYRYLYYNWIKYDIISIIKWWIIIFYIL